RPGGLGRSRQHVRGRRSRLRGGGRDRRGARHGHLHAHNLGGLVSLAAAARDPGRGHRLRLQSDRKRGRMTLIDTRLGPGTLLLGGTERGAQIANVSLEPKQDSSDGTPTLADPDPLPEVTESWTLKGSAIQDFENPDGVVSYCQDHALTV